MILCLLIYCTYAVVSLKSSCLNRFSLKHETSAGPLLDTEIFIFSSALDIKNRSAVAVLVVFWPQQIDPFIL